MEMIINLFRDGSTNADNPLQLAEAGTGDCSRRAEMVQQCSLAPRPDPGDVIKRRAAERLGAFGPVRANRKAVDLIAEALQKVEYGVTGVERERRSPGQKKSLAPGIAVGSLGYRRYRDIVDAELVENTPRGSELSQAAVDKDKIGPHTPIALRIFFKRPCKPALQHFTHHRVIVATG